MSKCEECIHEFEDANKPPCFACKENPNTKSLDNFKPKQPVIFDNAVDARKYFVDKLCPPVEYMIGWVTGFERGEANELLKLYFHGGYKELVELIEKRISLLEEDGRITPLDVEIKKAFENLKKPE